MGVGLTDLRKRGGIRLRQELGVDAREHDLYKKNEDRRTRVRNLECA